MRRSDVIKDALRFKYSGYFVIGGSAHDSAEVTLPEPSSKLERNGVHHAARPRMTGAKGIFERAIA
jgi:hypothetical protein